MGVYVRTASLVSLVSVLTMPAVSSAAIETNVNTVAELVNVLYWLKEEGRTSYHIVLAPGMYDLKDVAMTFEGVDRSAHLCVASTTIKGSTDNPRDTVLCGGGEEKKRSVIWGSFGKVNNLTISNGWSEVQGGGGYACRYTGRQANGFYRDVISNCVLTCNYANSAWQCGGGAQYVECYDSEICYNSTGSGNNCFGGGIGSCSCYSCFIHDNVSGASGGGCGPGTYFDCVISNNTAAAYGGGVGVNSGTNEMVRCTVVGNTSGTYGGGVGSNNSIIRDSLFCGNTAGTQGGGVYGGWLDNCVISNNMIVSDVNGNGNAYGAGLCYTKIATNCDVCFNSISETALTKGSRFGGGAYSSALLDCRVFGNSVFDGGLNRQGCGMYGGGATNCTFYNNYGPNASGVAINGGAADGCVFSNNVSMSHGRFAIRQPTGPITNCRIYGGWVESATQPFVNCVFTGQAAAGYFLPAGASAANPTEDVSGTWSGSYLFGSAYTHLRNCLICGMTGYAAMFCASKNYTVTIENCTFASNHFNTTFQNFTGSANYPYAAEVRNTIFVNNTQSSDHSRQRDLWYAAVESEGSAGNNIRFENCLIGTVRPETAPVSETGTVTTDNARFDRTEGAPPYSIKHGSPARGKGVVMDWMDGAPDIRNDVARYPRLRDGKVDIGCYQCWLDPVGVLLLVR